jgi:hypothetical protein
MNTVLQFKESTEAKVERLWSEVNSLEQSSVQSRIQVGFKLLELREEYPSNQEYGRELTARTSMNVETAKDRINVAKMLEPFRGDTLDAIRTNYWSLVVLAKSISWLTNMLTSDPEHETYNSQLATSKDILNRMLNGETFTESQIKNLIYEGGEKVVRPAPVEKEPLSLLVDMKLNGDLVGVDLDSPKPVTSKGELIASVMRAADEMTKDRMSNIDGRIGEVETKLLTLEKELDVALFKNQRYEAKLKELGVDPETLFN